MSEKKQGKKFQIKQMRERAGLSQQQVADELKIRVGRYGDWERETREINLRDAIKLADMFKCTLDELAGRDVSHICESRPLAHDEQMMVDGYRVADTTQKRRMLSAARLELEMAEESAIEKKEVI